jgi:hypothetical protein
VDDQAPGWTYYQWPLYQDPNCSSGTAHGGQILGGCGQYTFTGRGVEYYAWKGPDGGEVEIFVDGVSQGRFSLYNAGSEIYQTKIFEKTGLAAGTHKIKIVARSTGWTIVDYLRVK